MRRNTGTELAIALAVTALISILYRYWLVYPILQYLGLGQWRLVAVLVAATIGATCSLLGLPIRGVLVATVTGLFSGGTWAALFFPTDIRVTVFSALISHLELFWREVIILTVVTVISSLFLPLCQTPPTLTRLRSPHKLAPTGFRVPLATPLNPALYPRGTFVAAAGFIVLAVYYDVMWRRLRNSPPDAAEYPTAVIARTSPTDEFVERDYLYRGLAISIFCLLLAGSADTPSTPLDYLVGALMGLCGAIFAAMFAVGLVSLWNLWRESIGQFKYRLHLQRLVRSNPPAQSIKTGSFLLSIPRAISWLAAGLAAFIVAGMFVDKIPNWLRPVIREVWWFLIAAMFYALWKSGSHAAAILRFFLLSVFTAIILAALFFAVAWAASETAPLLVTLFAAITALNAVFYARWVRLKALINNLE